MTELDRFVVMIEARAQRELERLPRPAQARIRDAVDCLSADPFRSRSGCDIRLLRGLQGLRALRAGPYRVVYRVEGRSIVLVAVAHRSVVYRR